MFFTPPYCRGLHLEDASICFYQIFLQTVTSRLLVADTPAEAVENIILHTDKVSFAFTKTISGWKKTRTYKLQQFDTSCFHANFQAWLLIMNGNWHKSRAFQFDQFWLLKATDLLKRKKIKKELLFKYLHSKRVPIESVADKVVKIDGEFLNKLCFEDALFFFFFRFDFVPSIRRCMSVEFLKPGSPARLYIWDNIINIDNSNYEIAIFENDM